MTLELVLAPERSPSFELIQPSSSSNRELGKRMQPHHVRPEDFSASQK